MDSSGQSRRTVGALTGVVAASALGWGVFELSNELSGANGSGEVPTTSQTSQTTQTTQTSQPSQTSDTPTSTTVNNQPTSTATPSDDDSDTDTPSTDTPTETPTPSPTSARFSVRGRPVELARNEIPVLEVVDFVPNFIDDGDQLVVNLDINNTGDSLLQSVPVEAELAASDGTVLASDIDRIPRIEPGATERTNPKVAWSADVAAVRLRILES